MATYLVKIRRAYALGGCLMFMWLSMHGLLLYRRRSEYRALNEKLPPISWDEFVEKHLLRGEVSFLCTTQTLQLKFHARKILSNYWGMSEVCSRRRIVCPSLAAHIMPKEYFSSCVLYRRQGVFRLGSFHQI